MGHHVKLADAKMSNGRVLFDQRHIADDVCATTDEHQPDCEPHKSGAGHGRIIGPRPTTI